MCAAGPYTLIDQLCPEYDARRVERRIVRGHPATVYDSVLNADFVEAWRENPAVRLLFFLRSLGERMVSLLRGRKHQEPPEPASLRLVDMPVTGDWVLLGQEPPREVIFGVVGRFWGGETIWERIHASGFASFDQPGFAKIACNFLLSPHGEGRTLVSYEARTKATDQPARRAFLRYWKPLSPFIGVVMRSQLSVVEREASTRAGATRDGAASMEEMVRGVVVMVLGPLLVWIGAAASLVATARSARRRRLPSPLAVVDAAAVAVYAFKLRPWLRTWGSRPSERQTQSGGTRAVTVEAPVAEVWPWLAQLGQDRGGFYSYEWLENLAGCRMRNADRIHPEWQHREVGESVPLHPANGLKVTRFEPGRAFALEGWGAFELEAIDERSTRLIARNSAQRGLAKVAYAVFLEIPHFIMERKMLLGIKARAERASRTMPRNTAISTIGVDHRKE
jgi:hypothetical protein